MARTTLNVDWLADFLLIAWSSGLGADCGRKHETSDEMQMGGARAAVSEAIEPWSAAAGLRNLDQLRPAAAHGAARSRTIYISKGLLVDMARRD